MKQISPKPFAIASKFEDEESVSVVCFQDSLKECEEWFERMSKNYDRCDKGVNKLRVYTKLGALQYWVISMDCVL